MGKLANPVSLSDHFGINSDDLDALGVLDVSLNIDTKLYIDPLLLNHSSHGEISVGGERRLYKYFGDILLLIQVANSHHEKAWYEAQDRLTFPEIPYTCLGYGDKIYGHAVSPRMANHLAKTAKYIIRLGVNRPELFLLLPLLEDGFGPDSISDMTTNIILPDLLKFTFRICDQLEIETATHEVKGESYELPTNPYARKHGPTIFVPTDILRHLPIVTDWDEIADAASHNERLRSRVSQYIGNIWESQTRKKRQELRHAVLSSREAVESLIELIMNSDVSPYNVSTDPRKLLLSQKIRNTIARDFPLSLVMPSSFTPDTLLNIVKDIVEWFRYIIEDRGMANELLWHGNRHVGEVKAGKLFFICALSQCKANNIDITLEADTGPGPVDFKFSQGYDCKVLVEVKLSSNQNLVKGYKNQLEIYKKAEETLRAIYMIIDIGRVGKKYEKLLKVKNAAVGNQEPVSEIIYIDGNKKPPPSRQ